MWSMMIWCAKMMLKRTGPPVAPKYQILFYTLGKHPKKLGHSIFVTRKRDLFGSYIWKFALGNSMHNHNHSFFQGMARTIKNHSTWVFCQWPSTKTSLENNPSLNHISTPFFHEVLWFQGSNSHASVVTRRPFAGLHQAEEWETQAPCRASSCCWRINDGPHRSLDHWIAGLHGLPLKNRQETKIRTWRLALPTSLPIPSDLQILWCWYDVYIYIYTLIWTKKTQCLNHSNPQMDFVNQQHHRVSPRPRWGVQLWVSMPYRFRSRFQLLDRPWNHLGWFNQLWDPEKIGKCFSHGFFGFFWALYLTTLQTAGLSWSMGWKSNHDFPWAKCLCRKILQLSLRILIDIGGSWSRATCSKMRFVPKKRSHQMSPTPIIFKFARNKRSYQYRASQKFRIKGKKNANTWTHSLHNLYFSGFTFFPLLILFT